jgi:hypothetical protein
MKFQKILPDSIALIEKCYFMAAFLLLISAIILTTVHFAFFRFSFPPIRVDEASFLSPAYSLLTKGKFSSDIHASFLPGSESYTYWMPPFYMLSLAFFLKVAGIGINQAKLFSTLCVISASWCLGLSTKTWVSRCWIMALFLICPFVIFSSTTIRMEALGILLTSIAILFVAYKDTPRQDVVLGVIAALCFMTHPMVIACSIAVGIIMLGRGLKAFSRFLASALIVLSPYLIYITRDHHGFFTQMSLQFARKAGPGISTLTLSYAVQTLPLAVVALILVSKIHKNKELKRFLGIGLLLTVFLILKSQEFNYHVYAVPYTLSVLGFYIDSYQNKFKLLIPFVVLAFFISLLVGKAKLYHLHDDRPYYDLVEFLNQHQSEWSGKKIYVEGEPDVSSFFLVNGQDVERMSYLTPKGWADKYEYVICVTSRYPTPGNGKCPSPDTEIPDAYKLPWFRWGETARYSSRNDIYSLIVYER